MLQRLVRMFANNIDQEPRKDALEKYCDQNKEPSRVAIKDSQSTSIVPEPSNYVAAIYSGKLTSDRSRKLMERLKRQTLISLSIRVICKDEANSISLKKKTKYGFLFLISFVYCTTKRALEIFPEVLDVSQKFRVM